MHVGGYDGNREEGQESEAIIPGDLILSGEELKFCEKRGRKEVIC